MAKQGQGFESMDEAKRREAASKGGKATSASANRSEAGKKGARAQSTAGKAKGGHNSHKNS